MLRIDHLLWAVPDLDDGIAFFKQLTGADVVRGGSHPGRGTRNALASFGDGRYIELIAPDPAQPPGDNLGRVIGAHASPGLLTFAVGCADLDALAAKAAAMKLPCQGPTDGARQRPDGTTIHWRLLHTNGTEFGFWLPFYIDWLDTTHPSLTTPIGLQLLDFEVLHPKAGPLRELYQGLGLDVRVMASDRPGMRALMRCPNGQDVVLSSLG